MIRHPLDILARVQTDVSQHVGDEKVVADSFRAHRDLLAFQVAHRLHSLGCDELEAAAVESRQRNKR